MKRFYFLVALSLGSTYACASFELALVLDANTKKVHRYDAVSGAYLGSFGAFSDPQTITINKARNEAIVWDRSFNGSATAGAAFHFNYNTGELNYIAGNISSSVDWVSGRSDGTGYFLLNSAAAGYFDYNSAFTSGGLVPLAGVTGAARGEVFNSTRLVFQSNTNKLTMADTVAKAAVTTVTSGFAAIGDVTISPIAAFGGTIGAVSTGSGALQSVLFTDTSIGFGTTVSSVNSGFTQISGISATHNGIVAVGINAGGAAMMKNFAFARASSFGSSTFGGTTAFSIPQATLPIDVATVVAPEPSSIFGAGLGLALLVIRRKRSRS